MFRQYYLLAVLLTLLACARAVRGQYYFYNDKYYNNPVLIEVGLSVSGSNCLTDLGGSKGAGKGFIKDLNLENTHIGGGIYFGILFHQVMALRFEGFIGKLSASDQVLKDDLSEAKNRFNRNLSFQTTLHELSLTAEFHPMSCFSNESYPLFSPYLMAGVGVFKFNPRAMLNGKWIDLHPLRTEGQGFKEYPDRPVYRLAQINFPTGFGLRYEFSAIVNGRAEVVYRFLNTDYLDDVSTRYIDPKHFYTNLKPSDIPAAIALADRSPELSPGTAYPAEAIRGNPGNRDSYFSFNIKLGVVLNRKHR